MCTKHIQHRAGTVSQLSNCCVLQQPAGNYGNTVSFPWKVGVNRVSAGVVVSVVVTNVGADTWAALCDCFPEHFGRPYKNIA